MALIGALIDGWIASSIAKTCSREQRKSAGIVSTADPGRRSGHPWASLIQIVAAISSRRAISSLALIASIFIAQRSLYQHVAAVRSAFAEGGLAGSTRSRRHDRRARPGASRRSRRVPRRDRILRRELFRWRGGAGVLAGAAGTARIDRLQGHQYRRLHDRASVSERYESFGWAAARLDDLVNLVPARLSALLLAVAAPVARRIDRQIVRASSGAMPRSIARRMPAGRKARWQGRWDWHWPVRAAMPSTPSTIPFSTPRTRKDALPDDIGRALDLYIAACVIEAAVYAALTLVV